MHLSRFLLLNVLPWLPAAVSTASAAVPEHFQETIVASGLAQPAALAVVPDGRLLVAERAAGRVRVIKHGSLLATPLLDVKQALAAPQYLETYSERGLLGLAVDPQFPSAPYLYVYYTVCKVPGSGGYCQTAKNRVARFTVGGAGNPDVASPASQVILLDDIDSDAGNHNAGWLGFGPVDGKLYVAVGDGGSDPTKAQKLGSLNGKVLRLEASGAVPPDNPWVGVFGVRPEIYALGLRNPWRCRFHPDGRLFCADVGAATAEEVDWIVAGGNYGWPNLEGDFSGAAYPQYVRPLHAYGHDASGGACIAGGEFGSETNFPGDYQQSYFFADYVYGWLRRVVVAADGVTVLGVQAFGTGLGNPTEVVAGADGALYLPDITAGTVRRIGTTGVNRPPVAKVTATPAQGPPPLGVQLTSAGSGDPDGDPLTVTWDFGDGTPGASGATATHTYAAGLYTARVTVTDGQGGSDTATVTITAGTPPVVTIGQPAAGTLFVGGQTLGLAGSATDAEQGALPASALRWEVRFHHDDHWHPYLAELVGSPQSFQTATSGETAANVWYRVYLRATDAVGLVGETYVDVSPRTAVLRLETQPAGLELTLDGQPVPTPVAVTGVVGVTRTLGAPSPQAGYTFTGWSDGGVQVHTISTPAADTTYTATYSAPPTTTTPPSTTTTSAPTTTTGAPTSTTSSVATSSTTSTVAPGSTVATSSTTSTSTAPGPGGTTSTTRPGHATTTTAAPVATTTSTLPPAGCPANGTAEAMTCLIDEAQARLPLTSLESDRLVRVVSRRLRLAAAQVRRAVRHCEAGKTAKARGAVRDALRRVEGARTAVQTRSRRATETTRVTADDIARLEALGRQLRALAAGLSCP